MFAHRRILLLCIFIGLIISNSVFAQDNPTPEPPIDSAIPTDVPIIPPTATSIPTDIPTAVPSETFTTEPSLTPIPSSTPTETPSLAPSLTPSATDTQSPTITNTATASVTASLIPTSGSEIHNQVGIPASIPVACNPSSAISAVVLVSNSQVSSSYPSLSSDGNLIAFQSSDSTLAGDDTNNASDIFVYSRQTCVVTRISVSSDGTQADNNSSQPTISGDGRYVAFLSDATNLVAGDTNGRPDLFVKDTQMGTITRIQINQNTGVIVGSRPSLSNDGRYVAYERYEPNSSSNLRVISVYDLQTNTQQDIANGGYPAISGNGVYVAFLSINALVADDTNAQWDVYLYSRQTSQFERISVSSQLQQSNVGAFDIAPSLSADGRYVVFQSSASTLVSGDTNNTLDIFLRDRQISETTRLSITSGYEAQISADGRFVTFISGGDVYIRDIQQGVAFRVPNSSSNRSDYPVISGDGSYIAFQSTASNLVSGDTNDATDVFVAQRAAYQALVPTATLPAGCIGDCITSMPDTPTTTPVGGTSIPIATGTRTQLATNTPLPTATLTPIPVTQTVTPTLTPTVTNTPVTAGTCTISVPAGDTTAFIAAINSANTDYSTNDIICLATGSTYTFTAYNYSDGDGQNALPLVTSNIIIEGNGATVTRNSTDYFRFIDIDGNGVVTINSLTFTNGLSSSTSSYYPNNSGGALMNRGKLNLNNVVFSGNSAPNNGGAAVISWGTTSEISINNSSFINNTVSDTGALVIQGVVPVTINNTLFKDNHLTHYYGFGGASAIYSSTPLTITNSTFINNAGYLGGAILADKSLVIQNSIFKDNQGYSQGGAILTRGGTLDISNSVFINNRIPNGNGTLGGAIQLDKDPNTNTVSTLNITNSCIVNNSAPSIGAISQVTARQAQNNWWGSSDGPNIGSSGSGEPIASNFNVTPFLTTPPFANCPSLPPKGIPKFVNVLPNTPQNITLAGTGGLLPYTISNVSTPAHGTLSGTIPNLTYTPANGFSGTDLFTFTVTGADGQYSIGQVTLYVGVPPTATLTPTVTNTPTATSTPPPPTVIDQRLYSGASGIPITLAVTNGTTPYSYTITTSPTHGTVTGTMPSITYVPDTGYVGIDQLVYMVTDAIGRTASGTITISTYPVLTAIDRFINTPFDTPSTIILTATGGAQPYIFEVMVNPTSGTLGGTLPNLVYTPTTGYTGSDIFKFKVTDAYGYADTAYINIKVAQKLVLPDQNLSTAYETSLPIQITPSGGIAPYSYTRTNPSHGSILGTPPALVYIPTNGYSGSDSFTVTVTDAVGKSVTATINITIPSPFNVAAGDVTGLINAIIAANNSPQADTIVLGGGTYTLTTYYGTSSPSSGPSGLPTITGTLSIRGNGATITRSTAANTPSFRIMRTNGDVTISNLTLNNGKTGKDNSSQETQGGAIYNESKLILTNVQIINNTGYLGSAISNTALGQIVVTNSVIRNNTSTYAEAVYNNGQFTAANIIFANNGPNSGITAGSIEGVNAKVTITNSCITGNAKPAVHAGGSGGSGSTAHANVSNNWWGAITGPSLDTDVPQVGDSIYGTAVDAWEPLTSGILGCPTAFDQSLHTAYQKPIAITFTGTGGVAPYSFSVATGPTHGVLSGTAPNMTYTPNAGFSGTEKFTFRLVDSNGLPAVGLITIDVASDLVATNQMLGTPTDTALAITLSATGGKAPYSFSNFSTPAHGSLSGTGPSITYTPNSGYNGSDSFTFKVTDADGVVKTGTITIVVGPLVAQNQSLSTSFDTQIAITLGSSGGSAPYTYTIANKPINGVLSGAPPNITYLPTHPFTGTDSFTFSVTDSFGSISLGTVTIAVGAPPSATINVNSTAQEVPPINNGNCTLGEAIRAANSDTTVDGCAAGSGADIINVPAGTYVLPNTDHGSGPRYALPTISSEMTIRGVGMDQTKILRSTSDTGLVIFYNNGTLTLQGLTIGNSQRPVGAGSHQPAVQNTTNLTVIASKFIYNATDNGAAIDNETSGAPPPVAVVRDSVFVSNSSYSRGGAIYNLYGNLSVTNSVFYNNDGFDFASPVQGGTSIWSVGIAVAHNNCFLDGGSAGVLHGTAPNYQTRMDATNNWWGNTGTAVNADGQIDTSPTLAVRPAICDAANPAKLDIAAGDVSGLIAAIQYANTQSTPITINLATNATYTLTSVFASGAPDVLNKLGLPDIMANVIINGNGATITRSTANGTPEFRIFTAINAQLTINNLTISNGSTYEGGGIFVHGNTKLWLNNVTLLNNHANQGGGLSIANNDNEVNIAGSRFEGNTASDHGGALIISSSPNNKLNVSTTVFYKNQAVSGSSIQIDNNTNITVANSCFVQNANESVTHTYATPTINMINNWWNSINGPSGAGTGSGDSISTGVTYSPFLTTKPAHCPAAPLETQSQFLQVLNYQVQTPVTLSAIGGVGPYTYTILTNPQHGTLTTAMPDVSYQHNNGYIGTDSFTYQVTDTTGANATGTVTFNIRGANIQVNTLTQEAPFVNNGNCTLGEAIAAANTDTAVDGCAAGNGYDVISLLNGTYDLLQPDNTNNGPNGLPVITSDIAIDGSGATIQRSTAANTPDFRVFNVTSGSLDLHNLTVNNGRLVRQNFSTDKGGNIFASANLYLTNVTVTNGNVSYYGGGIYNTNANGVLSITDSTISNNTGPNGGGIFACSYTTILRSEISHNKGGAGGGININCNKTTISDSRITDNQASSSGGGVYVNTSNVSIINTVLMNNLAGTGSEVYTQSSGLKIDNSCLLDRTNSGVATQSSSQSITAKNNWWGSTSGPSGLGTGTGTTIVGQSVIYAPFKTSSILGCAVLPVIGVNQTVYVANNAPKAITVTAADGKPPYTFSIDTNPSHGTITGTLPNVTYTPATGYSGGDSFIIKAVDTNNDNAFSIISLSIAAPLVAPDRVLNVYYQSSGSLSLSASGGRSPYAFSIVTPPTHGTVSGTLPTVTYTPNQGYNGSDSIIYRVTDANGAIQTGSINITVMSPISTTDQSLVVLTNTSLSINLTASGGKPPYTYTITGNPAHGSIYGSIASWTYLPQSNYVGYDTIQYKVTDYTGLNATGTITIKVVSSLTLGEYQESNAQVSYTGNWINYTGTGPSNGAFKYTNDPNGKVFFWVDNSVGRIRIYRTLYNNYGSTAVYMDGGNDPIATINNTNATLMFNVPYTLSIPTGNHKIELRNIGSTYSSIDKIELLPPITALSTTPGTYQDNNVNLSYSGKWTYSAETGAIGGSRAYTNDPNASVSFFVDNNVGRITLYRTTYITNVYGALQVYLDNSITPFITINNTSASFLYGQPFTFTVPTGGHLITLKNVGSTYSDLDQIKLLPPVVPLTIGTYQETDANLTYNGNWLSSSSVGPLGGSRIYTNDSNGTVSFNIDNRVGRVTIYRTTYAAGVYGSLQVYLDNSATPLMTINNTSAAFLYGQAFTFLVTPGNHVITLKNVGTTYSDIDQITLEAATTPLAIGTYQETDSNLTYNGNWLSSSSVGPLGGSRKYTSDPNASVSFVIDASVSRVTLYRTMYAAGVYGSLQVYLDNSITPFITINNTSASFLYGQPFTITVPTGGHLITLKNVGTTYSDIDQIKLLPPVVPLTIGTYQETDANLTYNGNWLSSSSVGPLGGSRIYTNDSNGTVSFNIDNGVGRVTIYRTTYAAGVYGSLQVYLDNSAIPLMTINNTSASFLYGQPFTFLVTPGNHVITLKNVGTTYSDIDQITLEAATTPLTIGTYQETDANLNYNGNWLSSSSVGPLGGSRKYTSDPNASVSFVIDASVSRVTLYRTMYAAGVYGSLQVYLDNSITPFITINNTSASFLYGQPFTFTVPTGGHLITLKNVGSTYSDIDQIKLLPPVVPLTIGTYQETDANLTYNGNWLSSSSVGPLGGSRIYTNDSNGTVSFNIDNGVGRVTIYRTTYAAGVYGSLQVYLDNSATPLMTINNTSAAFLYGQPFTFLVTPGNHVITLKNVGTTYSDIDQITLEAATTPLAIGTYQETDSNLIYNGNWLSSSSVGPLGGSRKYTSDPNASVSFVIDASVSRVTLYRTTYAAGVYGSLQVYLDNSAIPFMIINNTSASFLYGQPFTFVVAPGNHVITLKNVGTTYSDLDQIVLQAGS